MSEMVLPWVRNSERFGNDFSITWMGRACSFVITVAFLTFGLNWEGTTFSIIELQLSMTLQTVPAFFIGLYSRYEFHPWPIATGALVGGAWTWFFYDIYMKDNPDRLPINNGVSGLGLNLAVIFIGESTRLLLFRPKRDLALPPEGYEEENKGTDASEGEERKKEPRLIFPNRPKFDIPPLAHFGDKPMTWRTLTKAMSGTYEVATNPYWVAFMLITMSLCTPLVPEKEPPFMADGTFAYPPVRIFGIPWFAWKSILFACIPSTFLLIEIWRMPTSFGPEKEDWEIFDDVPRPISNEKEPLLGETTEYKAQTTKESDDSSGTSKGNDAHALAMENAEKEHEHQC
jgi:hypothetical protein